MISEPNWAGMEWQFRAATNVREALPHGWQTQRFNKELACVAWRFKQFERAKATCTRLRSISTKPASSLPPPLRARYCAQFQQNRQATQADTE